MIWIVLYTIIGVSWSFYCVWTDVCPAVEREISKNHSRKASRLAYAIGLAGFGALVAVVAIGMTVVWPPMMTFKLYEHVLMKRVGRGPAD